MGVEPAPEQLEAGHQEGERGEPLEETATAIRRFVMRRSSARSGADIRTGTQPGLPHTGRHDRPRNRRALRAAGLVWSPAGRPLRGAERDLDDQVFVVSEMVIEVRETLSGQLLAFNGTTERALDSMDTGDAVWLPREDQPAATCSATPSWRSSGCPEARRPTAGRSA